MLPLVENCLWGIYSKPRHICVRIRSQLRVIAKSCGHRVCFVVCLYATEFPSLIYQDALEVRVWGNTIIIMLDHLEIFVWFWVLSKVYINMWHIAGFSFLLITYFKLNIENTVILLGQICLSNLLLDIFQCF